MVFEIKSGKERYVYKDKKYYGSRFAAWLFGLGLSWETVRVIALTMKYMDKDKHWVLDVTQD